MTQAQAQPPQTEDQPDIEALARDVFDHEQDEHLDAATLERVLETLLTLFPEAAVGAHTAEGAMVAMPDSIPLRNNPVLEARTGLDLTILDESIIRGWERVLAQGATRYPIHPPGHPEITLMVYALDLRENHGVVLIVCVLLPVDADGVIERPAPRPKPQPVAPRFARISTGITGIILEIDGATTQILGWSSEEMLGKRMTEFIHPDDQALSVDNWMEMIAHPGPGRRVRLRMRRRDDSSVWFEVTNNNLMNDPDHKCVVSECVDITEEMAAHEQLTEAHEELTEAHELLDRLAQTIPVGLFQVDADRRIVYTNDRLHEILGVAREDTVAAQLATVSEAERPLLDAAIDEVLETGLEADIEVELHLPEGGGIRFCTVSLRALGQANGTTTGVIACVVDVTDSARMREELKRQATFDDLTGCYNRASIMRVLEANIASGERYAERAVVFVDLDLFKTVNDEHGHAAGDELLSIVAQRLQAAVRAGDTVGRIGGDEFLLVCPEIGGQEELKNLAERVAAAQREDVNLCDGSIAVHVSIGLAWSSGDGTSADALVAQADKAMYESKRQGAGRPKLAVASVA
jgi:diguanylate cyclase (GGDEF)-like protein/PAS domain S-box-containing protein